MRPQEQKRRRTRATRSTLVLEEPERAASFRLALEDVDDHAWRVTDMDGTPVARLDQDDAIEPIEDDDGRVFHEGVDHIADCEDVPLLIRVGLHALSPAYGTCPTDRR